MEMESWFSGFAGTHGLAGFSLGPHRHRHPRSNVIVTPAVYPSPSATITIPTTINPSGYYIERDSLSH